MASWVITRAFLPFYLDEELVALFCTVRARASLISCLNNFIVIILVHLVEAYLFGCHHHVGWYLWYHYLLYLGLVDADGLRNHSED